MKISDGNKAKNFWSRKKSFFFFWIFSKIMELEEELKVVGNSLKSLEVSEEKVSLFLQKKKMKPKTPSVF